MASKKQGTGKDRTTNFTKEETTKLTMLLQDFPVITSKKTDYSSNQQKDIAWQSLVNKFNSDAIVHRNVKQLQQKFNNLKKIARKEMSVERNGRRQTGGGAPPPAPSETTEWLNSIMGESISGLPAVFDSDVTDNETVGVSDSMASAKISTLNTDMIVYLEDDVQIKTNDESSTQQTLNQMDLTCVPEEDEVKHGNPDFDTSTPQAMLRKPSSRQLLTSNNKRKRVFTPAETRKKIISHIDSKIDLITQKKTREANILKLVDEEHRATLAERKELHQKQILLMEEKHIKFLEQQKELHDMEVNFRKKMQNILLDKATLELEQIKRCM